MCTTLKSCLFIAALLLFSLVFFNQRAQAQTTIDTTPDADPFSAFSIGGTQETVGQVITAATTDRTLESFTFKAEAFTGNAGTLKFYIYAWDGTKAQGTELFHSEPVTIPFLSFPEVTVNTGGLPLTAGAQYVIFASGSELPAQDLLLLQTTKSDVYPGGNAVTLSNGSDTSKWTTDAWTSFPNLDLAFKATFIQNQFLQNLRDQVTTLTGENQTLQSQVNALMQQVQSLQDQVTTLTGQNQTLAQQNQTLQNQLASANQSISNLNSQVSQLHAELTQSQSAINALVNSIEANLRRTFNNPGFTIPGATPQQRLQNLINAILNLNKGRKEGIYQSLGGKS